jgi:hypothetical protein
VHCNSLLIDASNYAVAQQAAGNVSREASAVMEIVVLQILPLS